MAPPRYPQTVKEGRTSFGDDYIPFPNPNTPVSNILISSSYEGGGLFIRSIRLVHHHTSDFWAMLWLHGAASSWPIATMDVPGTSLLYPETVELITRIPGMRVDDPGIMIAPGLSLHILIGCTPETDERYYVSCEAGEYIPVV